MVASRILPLALLTNPSLSRAARNASAQFEKISTDSLRSGYAGITAKSLEMLFRKKPRR